jgi:hypothetical protein
MHPHSQDPVKTRASPPICTVLPVVHAAGIPLPPAPPPDQIDPVRKKESPVWQ